MAIKFQYNKTSLGELGKQLKMRERALPTLKNKESALRIEVSAAKNSADEYARELSELLGRYEYMVTLWGEFDADLLKIANVELGASKIAGVKIPSYIDVVFEQKSYNLFSSPVWYADGIAVLKDISRLGIQSEVFRRRTELLDHARKKTTQKVNLYEKVQIPGYSDAIRKIKRFMEDEDNLTKSAQKIVKTKHENAESL